MRWRAGRDFRPAANSQALSSFTKESHGTAHQHYHTRSNRPAPRVEFYRDGLGLPLYDENTESIAFFQNRGTWLALYPREALAKDVGIDASGQRIFRRHAGPQRTHPGRSGRPARRGRRGRGHPNETGRRHVLGRVLRLLRRPRRLPVGSRLESPLLDRVSGRSGRTIESANQCY